MIAEERREIILNKIKQNNFVSIEGLSQKLDVSHMTIRRDLEYLSSSGVIERCYGGAILKEEKSYSEKNISNSAAKELIAEKAITFIKQNDIIFLDAGTTTLHIAKKLIHRSDLTIVTGDIEISYLLKNAEPNLIIFGGLLQKETGSMIGNFAAEILNQINFNIAFVGAACIEQDFYSSTPTMEKVEIKKSCVRINSKSYLLADQSKFYKSALIRLNPLEEYTGVITDKIFTDEEKSIIEKRHITIIPVNEKG